MNSKRLLLFALSLLFFPLIGNAAVVWRTNYQEALHIGQSRHKPLLLFFNGSDWSGWAMKMKHEILDTPAFRNEVESEFVCVEIDFPKHSDLEDQLKAQNFHLKNKFSIEETPSLLILDSDERIIAKITYLPESGMQLAKELIRIVNQDKTLLRGLENLSSSDAFQLRQLYQLGQELQRESAVEKILAAGLKTDDPFFFTEKYRLLVENGKMRSEEACLLRDKISALDPENAQGAHFTIALIVFQELSRSNPAEAVKPLEDYLEKFGRRDPDNIWRIEMMIAQLYLERDACADALTHAQKAFEAAPEEMQDEISYSLEYIRSRTREIAQK